MSDIIDVKPDSLASTSPLITRASDVATIRIIPLKTAADWRIVEEYRDRSVLKGFSTVGGLWTFFSGIFVALFGSSLSMVVFSASLFLTEILTLNLSVFFKRQTKSHSQYLG